MRIHSYSNIPDNTTDSALTNAEVSKYNSVKLGRSSVNPSVNKITRNNQVLCIIKSNGIRNRCSFDSNTLQLWII